MTDIRKVEVSGPHVLGDGRYAVRFVAEGMADSTWVFDDVAEARVAMDALSRDVSHLFQMARTSGMRSEGK